MTAATKKPAELDPATFDLNDWISGATTTERAVTVYRNARLIARLDVLKQEIAVAERIPAGSRSVTDPSPRKLKAEWDAVAKEFADSALIVTVRGLTQERATQIRKESVAAAVKASKTALTKEQKASLALRSILVEAIVSPKFTDEQQVLAFANAIGDGQYIQVIEAYQTASNLAPTVTAPFSLPSSDEDDGEE